MTRSTTTRGLLPSLYTHLHDTLSRTPLHTSDIVCSSTLSDLHGRNSYPSHLSHMMLPGTDHSTAYFVCSLSTRSFLTVPPCVGPVTYQPCLVLSSTNCVSSFISLNIFRYIIVVTTFKTML